MKILHIITRLDRGGSAEVVLNLVSGLKEKGHDVFLAVGPTVEPQADIKLFSKNSNIPVSYLKFLIRNINPFRDIPAFFEILKLIKKIKPDVLHTHTSKAGFLGRIAGRLAGVKTVVHTPHGHIFYGYYNSLISRIFIYLEKLASRFCDKIITLTEIEKREYIKEGVADKEKIISIPCGIDIDRFTQLEGKSHPSLLTGFTLNKDKSIRNKLAISPDAKVIGWAGRLEPVKGCEYFLRACHLIKKDLPDVKFLIVGDGPLRKEMEELALSLDLKNEVIFLGFRNDMPEIMNSIDVLVHTPLNEGLGRVLLEAMACGKPIVAANVGGIPEIVKHDINGILVPSKDYVSTANETIRILKDKKLAERLGEGGKKVAMGFSIKTMVEKTNRLYNTLLAIIFILSILFGGRDISHAMEWVPAVIHLDTNISDGTLSPEEMIEKVKEAGIKIAVINDKDNQRLEYGIFPLRKIIRRVEERNSIMTYGAKNYLDRIAAISKKNPDMTIIAGVEAVPFYYWDGSYFTDNLKLINFHKHLLIIGLEKSEDLESIPSVSYNNTLTFDLWCFFNILPIFLVPLGIWMVLHKKIEHVQLMQLRVKKEKRPYLIIGILVLFTGAVFTINNFPFGTSLYDPYHGDKGALPYQNLIDYVEKKGGMIFFAHPDVEARHKINDIEINTHQYSEELLRTQNYTGFAVFAEGIKYTGRPGGVWDNVLNEYINGQRKKPVWAIGELDYKEGNWMGDTQTIFLVNKNTKEEILNAMRFGRMYAVYGMSPILETFQIWDDKKGEWVDMGGEAAVDNKIRLKIKVSLPELEKKAMKLKIIREGDVIKEIDLMEGINIEWEDESMIKTFGDKHFNAGKKTYYRIDIDSRLISNPIFVRIG
ncbi:MAG: glycosyltransferase [Deltaproteobacteria bacterium]|nr:glycosyltransferase [Deltaproteobacteria bacterium]